MSDCNNGAACCGNCHHWHKQPLPPGQVPMVGQPAQGQCREGPPCVTSIPAQGGLMQVTDYPKPLENCPACSRFRAKLAVLDPSTGHFRQG